MKSIRDLYKIGKGPSSSHTMGPERAARLFLSKYPDAETYRVVLYGSLSKTGRGHGTDRVLYEVLGRERTEGVFSEETPHSLPHPRTAPYPWQAAKLQSRASPDKPPPKSKGQPPRRSASLPSLSSSDTPPEGAPRPFP